MLRVASNAVNASRARDTLYNCDVDLLLHAERQVGEDLVGAPDASVSAATSSTERVLGERNLKRGTHVAFNLVDVQEAFAGLAEGKDGGRDARLTTAPSQQRAWNRRAKGASR